VNTAESVKARLKKIAVAENKPFNYILTHYFIERLLYRFSMDISAVYFWPAPLSWLFHFLTVICGTRRPF
jgi:hypothetical protein